MNFITYLEQPYLLELQLHSVPFPTSFFFVSAYLNGEGVQEFLTETHEEKASPVHTTHGHY